MATEMFVACATEKLETTKVQLLVKQMTVYHLIKY